jgi:hypothetical protein
VEETYSAGGEVSDASHFSVWPPAVRGADVLLADGDTLTVGRWFAGWTQSGGSRSGDSRCWTMIKMGGRLETCGCP